MQMIKYSVVSVVEMKSKYREHNTQREGKTKATISYEFSISQNTQSEGLWN